MREFALIETIRRSTPHARRDVTLGIGDDAALLRVPGGHELVVSTDTLVAGVHFPEGTAPAALGWKALAVNLSDLAAMGATPAWITLALTLPEPDARFVRAFVRGFHALARRHGVALVGGDTTRGPLAINVGAFGFVPRGRGLRRDGARLGDDIYVSGTIGDAAAGLAVRRGRLPANPTLIRRLERPEPRLSLGLALRGVATAAIDVSDGLAADLGHVLSASGVGARVDAGRVPTSAALRRALPDAVARRTLQLQGGDDYELCFTARPDRRDAIARRAARLRIPLTRIGSIERRRGLRVTVDGETVRLARRGYEHFA